MIPAKTSGETYSPRDAAAPAGTGGRSVLEQLLHALNQPLTGLQCSMEVALASPRTPEQYVRGLHEGLALTERMRALVEAIREVADVEEEKKEELETIDLKVLLGEVVDDLGPVAEAKRVRITLDCSATASLGVVAGGRRFSTLVFRLLESALSLAGRGSGLRVEAGGAPAGPWICVRWHGARPGTGCSRPELGLLVAQAGLEQAGAEWIEERTEILETVTVRLPRIAGDSK
jgi:hypothetical protein